MEVGTLITKLTSSKLAKIFAEPWVPHETLLVLAGEAGAGVDDVLLLAGSDKLAMAVVVEFADIFQGFHFQFLFLE